MKLFAHKTADAIPVACAILHTAYLGAMLYVFPRAPWWTLFAMGLAYSVSISWNINGIAHNFIHNPYFVWSPLNRAFSWLLSVTMGFSQQFYELIHNRHHQGNSDRPDENGETADPLSIYKHGHDGEAESAWTYTFFGFFRDDPKAIFRDIKKRSAFNAYWGVFEIVSWILLVIGGFFVNWKFMLFFFPFYYFGHCLSYLNGYFLHFGGNPDVPLAWGVSSYHKLYNLIWFNNGYHAEHHYKPKVHWTEMKALREKILDQQRRAGTRVIKPPHALGFMDPDLPARHQAHTDPVASSG
ncbi:MAG: fatty acid desaturase [Verrucomicrobiota bacterium]|nr:fatty acid desaturase [Verrucomicrobiota bacterium]